ncbi:MAG TPA: AHH domain-containing protein, partial [Iamia sp.]
QASHAAVSREMIKSWCISINDAMNGVFLRYQDGVAVGADHRVIHTTRYYEEVETRLTAARSRGDAARILEEIRRQLEADVFPY